MLKKHLASYNILTEEEIDNFINLVNYKKLNKGDFFIQEGNTCKEVAFIASGIFRSFYHSSDEKEATYCLLSENSFVTAYSSFISQTKTNENIQALTDAELYSISKEQFAALENSSTNWLRLFKIFAEQEYINLENRIFVLQNESAENRYSVFATNVRNVSGYIAKFFTFDLRNDVKKGTLFIIDQSQRHHGPAAGASLVPPLLPLAGAQRHSYAVVRRA